MSHITNNNQNIQNNIQAEIKFLQDKKTLIRNLPRIDKSLRGHKYKYQDFNYIVEEIYNVIEKHNLDLFFTQDPISKYVDDGQREHVIRTTFYSTSTGTENHLIRQCLQKIYNVTMKMRLKLQIQCIICLVQTITHIKRHALVSDLDIRSEVDTDAVLIYNNDENKNSTPNKQIIVNKKQEQKKIGFIIITVFLKKRCLI